MNASPRVVLICHEDDRIDNEIIASWLAASFQLAGVVRIREPRFGFIRRIRNEIRRNGILRLIDVLAFRAYYKLFLARRDAAWIDAEVRRSREEQRGGVIDEVMKLTAANPNDNVVARFLTALQPDLVLARCKFILKPEIFSIPRAGTWVLHPGICPEYRNAHGCFWALARRDLNRVGMTLLRVDRGIDTGPVYLQASYAFNERTESHIVIQYRAVLENLDKITSILKDAVVGTAQPLVMEGRRSAAWGQPWLSEYFRWRRAAREAAV